MKKETFGAVLCVRMKSIPFVDERQKMVAHTRLEGQWLDIHDCNLCTRFLEQEGEEFSDTITSSSDYDDLLIPFMFRPIPIIQRSRTEEIVQPSDETEINKDLEATERLSMAQGEASTTSGAVAEKVYR